MQHRVGDLPFLRYISRILTGFLQDDLGLPLKHQFDLGEEQDDRHPAGAGRQDLHRHRRDRRERDPGDAVRPHRPGADPAHIMTTRSGPVPVSALLAVAGEIDPATALPAEGSALPDKVFAGVEGVIPEPAAARHVAGRAPVRPEGDAACAAAAAADDPGMTSPRTSAQEDRPAHGRRQGSRRGRASPRARASTATTDPATMTTTTTTEHDDGRPRALRSPSGRARHVPPVR